MAVVPHEIVLGYLDDRFEIPAALVWADYHRLDLRWDRDDLSLSLRLSGRSESDREEPYLLTGWFEDYRVLPPAWRFLDPRNGNLIGLPAYPLGNWPTGSIFHGNGLICAPWSRDAYADRGGPHNDWTDATLWETIGPQHSQATTIPDMLARIHAEVQASVQRIAPLPELAQAA
jgi:hypothetical protein